MILLTGNSTNGQLRFLAITAVSTVNLLRIGDNMLDVPV